MKNQIQIGNFYIAHSKKYRRKKYLYIVKIDGEGGDFRITELEKVIKGLGIRIRE